MYKNKRKYENFCIDTKRKVHGGVKIIAERLARPHGWTCMKRLKTDFNVRWGGALCSLHVPTFNEIAIEAATQAIMEIGMQYCCIAK